MWMEEELEKSSWENLEEKVDVEEPSWWAVQEEEIVPEESSDETSEKNEESEPSVTSEEGEQEWSEREEKKSMNFVLRLVTDSWQGPNKKGEIYHLNKTGRKGKINPKVEGCPVEAHRLEKKRITVKTKEGRNIKEEDEWNENDEVEGKTWTGLIVFFVKDGIPDRKQESIRGRHI